MNKTDIDAMLLGSATVVGIEDNLAVLFTKSGLNLILAETDEGGYMLYAPVPHEGKHVSEVIENLDNKWRAEGEA